MASWSQQADVTIWRSQRTRFSGHKRPLMPFGLLEGSSEGPVAVSAGSFTAAIGELREANVMWERVSYQPEWIQQYVRGEKLMFVRKITAPVEG